MTTPAALLAESVQSLAGLLGEIGGDHKMVAGLLQIVLEPVDLTAGTLSDRRDRRDRAIRADKTLGPAISRALHERRLRSYGRAPEVAQFRPRPVLPAPPERPQVAEVEIRHAA